MVLKTTSNPIAPADGGYQGMTNYATWALHQHMASDSVLFNEVLRPICTPEPSITRGQWPGAKIEAADKLRDYTEALFSQMLDRSVGMMEAHKMLLLDLMRNSMDNVNYREIVDIHWNK